MWGYRLYHTNALAALRKVESVWDGEAVPVIAVADGVVPLRTILLVEQAGSWNGARFTYGKNMAGCTRIVLEDEVYAALHGFGAGLPVTDEYGVWTGGYRRKLTPGDVNGDINWGWDDEAHLVWGRWNADRTEKVHSFGQITFSDCEDQEELLALTTAALADACVPKVSYEVDIALLDGGIAVGLGDAVAVIDSTRDPEWRSQARVLKRVKTFSDVVATHVSLGNAQKMSFSASVNLAERVAAVESMAGAASDTVVAISEAVTITEDDTAETLATETYVNDAIVALDDLSEIGF